MLLELHARHSSELSASPRLPLTVMAVDDNPANLKLIGALLEEQGQHIVLCNNAEQAIRVAHRQVLDVILMDIQMPDIDGIRASEIIRTLPNHATTPIVAVTAHAIDGEREHLIRAGMNDYLAKPIDENKLAQVLARTHRLQQQSGQILRVGDAHMDDVDVAVLLGGLELLAVPGQVVARAHRHDLDEVGTVPVRGRGRDVEDLQVAPEAENGQCWSCGQRRSGRWFQRRVPRQSRSVLARDGRSPPVLVKPLQA